MTTDINHGHIQVLKPLSPIDVRVMTWLHDDDANILSRQRLQLPFLDGITKILDDPSDPSALQLAWSTIAEAFLQARLAIPWEKLVLEIRRTGAQLM